MASSSSRHVRAIRDLGRLLSYCIVAVIIHFVILLFFPLMDIMVAILLLLALLATAGYLACYRGARCIGWHITEGDMRW
jgi:hypothetical protein